MDDAHVHVPDAVRVFRQVVFAEIHNYDTCHLALAAAYDVFAHAYSRFTEHPLVMLVYASLEGVARIVRFDPPSMGPLPREWHRSLASARECVRITRARIAREGSAISTTCALLRASRDAGGNERSTFRFVCALMDRGYPTGFAPITVMTACTAESTARGSPNLVACRRAMGLEAHVDTYDLGIDFNINLNHNLNLGIRDATTEETKENALSGN